MWLIWARWGWDRVGCGGVGLQRMDEVWGVCVVGLQGVWGGGVGWFRLDHVGWGVVIIAKTTCSGFTSW